MRENMIKKLTTSDINLIIDYLKDDSFDCCEFNDFWSEQELHQWFDNPDHICIGYYNNKELIGFCLSHLALEINKVYLENIFVSPAYRHQGIATKMLGYVLQKYRIKCKGKTIRFVAMVDVNNSFAKSTLNRCGFNIGDTMNWVQKNVDY